MDLLFPHGTSAHWAGSIGFIFTMWLGVYLATHAPRSSPARLAILSLFALSGYFLQVVLCLFLPAQEAGFLWRRHLGWMILLPLPLWLHLTSLLLAPEQQKRQHHIIWLTYGVSAFFSIIWVFGDWRFTRENVLPPELVWPISLFALAVGGMALVNVGQLRRQAADETLRHRYTLLGAFVFLLIASILYWPVAVNLLQVVWSPSVRLVVGNSIVLAATAVLAYAISHHNAFMSGRWVQRDFFFHAMAMVIITAVYLIIMYVAWQIAVWLGFNVPSLVMIAVVALAIATHLLALPARHWWDRLFFKQIRALPDEIGGLMGDMHASADQLEEQMTALVYRLKDLTGASTTCIALREDSKFIIKASTDPKRLNWALPSSFLLPLSSALITRSHNNGSHDDFWDCLVLAEPILVSDKTVGYLLLGERGVGEGYDRQERVWVSTLAAYMGAMLERARWRTMTERRIVELSAEAEALAVQEQSLKRDFEAALAGPPGIIRRGELREAIYAFSRPDRLRTIMTRKESTLAALPCVASSELQPAQAFQQQLTLALDAMVPPDGLPTLESLRDRPIRSKRRRHIPTSVANYYTLRLVMTGYTHEAVAEMLEISPRQVRNYLSHAVGSVKVFLEQAPLQPNVKIA